MTGRERFLCAIANGTPDHLACQVHGFMDYYLRTYLGGMDQYEAYAYFDMDPVIYEYPTYSYSNKDLAAWQVKKSDLGANATLTTITTPEGVLTERTSFNRSTQWTTEHLIKCERDFEIWNKYLPEPIAVDWGPITRAKARIGETGIVRGAVHNFGQGSPWQSFCTLYGTEQAIYLCFDNPEFMHHALDAMLNRTLRAIERFGVQYDLVETGGGAGSSSVISPALHREFCLPYDQRQHKLIHDAGAKIVYHLCGALMPLLETVQENGADALETMTPPGMGGDCDLAAAERRVGDKLSFIGGFDQNAGFEKGTPEKVYEMVEKLHAACPKGGYIMSPSDHFFFGDPENIRAFAQAAKQAKY